MLNGKARLVYFFRFTLIANDYEIMILVTKYLIEGNEV